MDTTEFSGITLFAFMIISVTFQHDLLSGKFLPPMFFYSQIFFGYTTHYRPAKIMLRGLCSCYSIIKGWGESGARRWNRIESGALGVTKLPVFSIHEKSSEVYKRNNRGIKNTAQMQFRNVNIKTLIRDEILKLSDQTTVNQWLNL